MLLVCYLAVATGHVWLISYKSRLSHWGSDVGQIFRQRANIKITQSCEKELSHMGKNNSNPDLVCESPMSTICRFILFCYERDFSIK